MLDPLLKRKSRRLATKLLRRCISSFGTLLPKEPKIWLAKRSTKMGYLLDREGDFLLSNYLDSFTVNINTKITTERVMLSGKYEKDLEAAVGNYVSKGDTALDIGANIGATTLLLARAVGPKGKVFAFEPGPRFFTRLKKNVELNPALNSVVKLYNLGLADKKGQLHWREDPDFPGNAHMFGGTGTKVEVQTLDAVLEQQLDRLDFIKIDVEGMELEVLKGAQKTLQRFLPKIFLETAMEFEVYRQNPIRKHTTKLLTDLGYRLFRISDCGKLEPVEYPHLSQNTLALPPHHA